MEFLDIKWKKSLNLSFGQLLDSENDTGRFHSLKILPPNCEFTPQVQDESYPKTSQYKRESGWPQPTSSIISKKQTEKTFKSDNVFTI